MAWPYMYSYAHLHVWADKWAYSEWEPHLPLPLPVCSSSQDWSCSDGSGGDSQLVIYVADGDFPWSGFGASEGGPSRTGVSSPSSDFLPDTRACKRKRSPSQSAQAASSVAAAVQFAQPGASGPVAPPDDSAVMSSLMATMMSHLMDKIHYIGANAVYLYQREASFGHCLNIYVNSSIYLHI